jgi:predicted dehydrogenase
VVVGFKKAFMPGIRRLRDLLRRPSAGRLLNVIGEYPVTLPVANGSPTQIAGATGDWQANGCHPLAAMLALGGPVTHLTTHLSSLGTGIVALEFANGAIGSLNIVPLRGVHDRYTVLSEGCHAEVENGWTVRWHRGGSRSDAWDFTSTDDHGGTVTWEPDNAFARYESRMHATQGFWHELDHFCTCIAAQRPASEGTLEFARDLQRVWDAALISAGQRVAV